MTSEQTSCFFYESSVRTSLKYIEFSCWNLLHVKKGLVGLVFSSLEEVAFGFENNIKEEQLEELFKALGTETKLQSLFLSKNDLSGVDPDILVQGVTQLQLAFFMGHE